MENDDLDAGKYSQPSYDKYDSFAKEKFIKYITSKGFNVIKSEEDFEHDIIAEKDGKKYYFELEIKKGYPFKERDTFLFNTVSFLSRKKRLHDKQKFWYVIICKETGWALFCKSKDIFLDKYFKNIVVNAENRKGKDKAYHVPIDYCYFRDINIVEAISENNSVDTKT